MAILSFATVDQNLISWKDISNRMRAGDGSDIWKADIHGLFFGHPSHAQAGLREVLTIPDKSNAGRANQRAIDA